MANNAKLLFAHECGWSIKNVGAPWETLPSRSTNTNHLSSPSSNVSTLHRDIIAAVMAYASQGGIPCREVALVEVSSEKYAAEYHHSDGTVDVLTYNESNGLIEAANVTATEQYVAFPPYGGKKELRSIASIIFVLLPVFMKHSNIRDDLKMISDWQASGASQPTNDTIAAMYRINDGIYRQLMDGTMPIIIDPYGNVSPMTKASVKSGANNGAVLCGNPKLLAGASGKYSAQAPKSKTILELCREPRYKLYREKNMATLSPEMLKEIPNMPSDTVVPEFVTQLADIYMATETDPESVNAIRIEGSTGTGKTFGAKLLAALLGKPYCSINLNPDTDKMELKSQIVPATSGCNGFAVKRPSVMEICCDPVTAYANITGRTKKDASVAECQKAYDNAMSAGGESSFVHVKSELLRGLMGPYLVEIQEMSRAKAGVLSGLNEIFDREGVIHMESTGESFKRHPQSIVVSTDNIDYPGCRKLSPDVRSRFSVIKRLENVEKEELISRVQQRVPSFKDRKMLGTMCDIVEVTANFCRENQISDGDIGPRELMAWAVVYSTTNNALESFKLTVLNKAAGNEETAEEILTAITASKAVGNFFN